MARPRERQRARRGRRRPRGRGRRAKRRGGRRLRACWKGFLEGKEAIEGPRGQRKEKRVKARERGQEKFFATYHSRPPLSSPTPLPRRVAFPLPIPILLFPSPIAMRSSCMASTTAGSSRAAAVARRSTVTQALFSRKSSTAVVDAPAKGRKG